MGQENVRKSCLINFVQAGYFPMLMLYLLTFFKLNFYKKLVQEHYWSVKQFGSRSGPGLNVQTVFKGYQQTTKVTIDESKHYVTNQHHPEHYGLYPKAGKYSGWQ